MFWIAVSLLPEYWVRTLWELMLLWSSFTVFSVLCSEQLLSLPWVLSIIFSIVKFTFISVKWIHVHDQRCDVESVSVLATKSTLDAPSDYCWPAVEGTAFWHVTGSALTVVRTRREEWFLSLWLTYCWLYLLPHLHTFSRWCRQGIWH